MGCEIGTGKDERGGLFRFGMGKVVWGVGWPKFWGVRIGWLLSSIISVGDLGVFWVWYVVVVDILMVAFFFSKPLASGFAPPVSLRLRNL